MAVERPVVDRLEKLALSAVAAFPDTIMRERDASPSMGYWYGETHLALLMSLLRHRDADDGQWLQRAANRLRLWDELQVAPSFFNAMAVCLTRIELNRSDVRHPALEATLASILDRCAPAMDAAWRFNCGNNMYLQQVVIDRVLIPAAAGLPISDGTMAEVADEFARFQTPEGYFFDLPRDGNPDERLLPLAYVLKILFLLGICRIVRPYAGLEGLLRRGLEATVPLFTGEGTLSYLGRTDNTTFAAGLSSFCLHLAVELGIDPARSRSLARCNRDHWLSFDVGDDGCLEVNRYGPSSSRQERVWSADDYAYRWQYALAGAAYTALGYRFLPQALDAAADGDPRDEQDEAVCRRSDDLGLIKIRDGRCDLYLRTRSDFHANDRRYLGPTILRLEHDGQLLVGAIPRTSSTEPKVRAQESPGRLKTHLGLMRYRYREGWAGLDATTAAFIPVLTHGPKLWLPCSANAVSVDGTSVRSEHPFRAFRARGIAALWLEARDLLAKNLPGLFPAPVVPPQGMDRPGVLLVRVVECHETGIRITDRLTGDLRGKTLWIATRAATPLDCRPGELSLAANRFGWGSDGRQELAVYTARPTSSAFSYHMDIAFPPRAMTLPDGLDDIREDRPMMRESSSQAPVI